MSERMTPPRPIPPRRSHCRAPGDRCRLGPGRHCQKSGGPGATPAARALVSRSLLVTVAMLLTMIVVSGCGGSDRSADASRDEGDDSPPAAGDPESSVDRGPAPTAPAETLPTVPGEPDPSRLAVTPERGGRVPPGQLAPGQSPTGLASPGPSASGQAATGSPGGATPDRPRPSARRPLREDLSPAELLQLLAEADRLMRSISSGQAGIFDEDRAREELRTVAEQKLEASRRLAGHDDADDDARTEGRRGELQALSHLASLGDLRSAEELERLAESYLDDDRSELRADARMVRIGFAIENLRHGRPDAAGEIVDQVRRLSEEASDRDMPAMIVMAQAREALDSYEQSAEAREVRGMIIDRFAGSQDPAIADMAAQFAGSVLFDDIEPLRAAAVAGDAVSETQWQQAMEGLIAASADIATVRYLAGAALELEGAGRDSLADRTYETLRETFADPQVARDREAQAALAARDARRRVIGRPFDPDLPALDGSSLDFQTFRGRIVIMPFWAAGIPESLQLLDQLIDLRDRDPDRVAIVGMNLDMESVTRDQLRQFSEEVGIDFPNYRSESSPSAAVANEVAQQFGLVSLPFTVIFGGDGQVVSVELNGEGVAATVRRLLDRAEASENAGAADR